MLLLYYYLLKNAGENRACAEHTSGLGLFRSLDFVTSGEKGTTRADIVQLPVAHAQNILPDMTRD